MVDNSPSIELFVSRLQNYYSLASSELFYKYSTYRELSSLLKALLSRVCSSSFFTKDVFVLLLFLQRIDESDIKAILNKNDLIRITFRQSIVLLVWCSPTLYQTATREWFGKGSLYARLYSSQTFYQLVYRADVCAADIV